MLKSLAARLGATATSLALMGAVYAAIPAGTVSALEECPLEYPQVRTGTTISAPYGVSASRADLITVKVVNTTGIECDDPVVVITPREGFVFHSIVSTTGGWMCQNPLVPFLTLEGSGVIVPEGTVVCHNEILKKYSSNTIRVRYDRITPGGPVSGTASAELSFDDCKILPPQPN